MNRPELLAAAVDLRRQRRAPEAADSGRRPRTARNNSWRWRRRVLAANGRRRTCAGVYRTPSSSPSCTKRERQHSERLTTALLRLARSQHSTLAAAGLASAQDTGDLMRLVRHVGRHRRR